MLSRLLDKIAESPRESLFLAAVTVVIGALLASMYMVCNSQVRAAEAYHASLRTQRLAVLDCVNSDRRASYSACASQVAMTFQNPGQPSSALLTIEGAQPVYASITGYAPLQRSQVAGVMPVAHFTR